ncbi:MAG: asparagine synthase-related protein, partial [Armatimonadia bacterium]
MKPEAAVVPDMGKGKVFVAMSGGVDSSVAALLLQRQGYDVVGVTFKLFENEDIGEDAERACCSLDSIERARAVCNQLGITHYVMSMVTEFAEAVIDRFVCEYAAGRTPNPCINCNTYVKFGALRQRALEVGARWVATG